MTEPVLLHSQLGDRRPDRTGKVRDLYDLGEALLIIASDRLSAFDVVLPDGIPGKGRTLTALSLFWFDLLREVAPNHLIATEVADYPAAVQPFADQLVGRSMLVKKAQVVPVECVVRGYLAGSGWKEYRQSQSVCGVPLPAGLRESDQLPQPIFTPTTKAESGHDLPMTKDEVVALLGAELTERLVVASLDLYTKAAEHARTRGVIIADTKFEFGLFGDELLVVDEVLTPDSSRFWDVETYAPGRGQDSFDKQYVRDYLETLDWNKQPPAPPLPAEIVARTGEKYREAYRRIVGREL